MSVENVGPELLNICKPAAMAPDGAQIENQQGLVSPFAWLLSHAQLLEARSRPVDITDVEDLEALNTTAVGHENTEEDVLERAAIAFRDPHR